MRGILRSILVVASSTLLLACSTGGTPTGGVGPDDATAPAPTCSEPAAGTAADVEATVSANTWGAVTASAGDVITWTNSDPVPHKVGLDDGSCTMSANIDGNGGTASLIFNNPGSYPFHCTVHPGMKGTIVVS
jgi:plastocyanin